MSTSDAASDELVEELIQLLARQARRVPVPVFLCSLFLAAMAFERRGGWLPWIWLAAATLVLGIRWKLLGDLPSSTARPHTKLEIAVALSALNGIVQGSSIGFTPFLDAPERAVQSIVLLALCAGSVVTTGGYRPAFVAFVAPTLLPLAMMWALGLPGGSHRWTQISAGALILVFGLVLLALAKDAFRLFKESFQIRQEQVSLNRQLREALGEAESANRAKTRFLASASHDLRQPMHTLSLFGAALTMRTLDAGTRQVAVHMNTALKALSEQLDALLDVSKLDAGVVPVRRTVFSLSTFLNRIAGEFQPMIDAKGLLLAVSCPTHALCETDEVLLGRIVRNLVENSLKYTPHGEIRLLVETRDEWWVLAIEDSGIGIADAEQQKVFEEFYQVGNPERDRSRGLGLGLSIVRRLAQLLELETSMTSTLGVGTMFSVSVPVVHRVATSELSGSNRADGLLVAGSLRGLRVLVLDDEEAVRVGMETLLKAFGCEVCLAGCIAEAVADAQRSTPDILIVDLRLRAGENGIAAIDEIRAICPGLPAVLVSGDTAPDRIKEAHGAGIPLLHKPVSAEALHAAIVQGISRKDF